MKTIFNKGLGFAVAALFMGSMASCVSETPFSNEDKVLVKMNVMVNPAVTRAVPENNQELLDKCVVYVSNSNGLLHKWIGVENIPSEIYMRYGSYVAEAWSGDSVTAAYESENKKFYKGIESFEVDGSTPNVQVNLRCTLANVVASVDQATLDSKYVKDVRVNFTNSRGELSFDSDNWAEKGYFMMPTGDSELSYVVEFKNVKGEEFKKEGVISDVKSAHEYRLKFEYNPAQPTDGGAFVQIVIDETEITDEQDVYFLGGPEFYWVEDDVNVGEQIIGAKGEFITHFLRVAGFGDATNGFKSIVVSPVEPEMFKGLLPDKGGNYTFDIVTVTEKGNSFRPELKEKGIEIKKYDPEQVEDAGGNIYLHKFVLELHDTWLNSLPESDSPYELTVTATDFFGKTNETIISIANTNKAIAKSAPIMVDTEALNGDYMAIRARSVTLPLAFEDDADLTNVALQYRKNGETNWHTQAINVSRGEPKAYVSLTNLEPGTTYEYRTVGGEVANGEYELKSKEAAFTTESIFEIPNASMEDWSNFNENAKVLIPGANGVRTFWDSGNHGSATMNVTLTQPTEDMKHSGTKSARLRSQFVGLGGLAGKFAAGNLFAGTYLETQGTDGRLEFGREYNGSHPKALSLWANYRPGKAEKNGAKDGYLAQGDTDQGQIYVALATEPVEVRTKPSNQKLFDPTEPVILAYGQVTWTEDFGADGQLQQVTIPLEYYERAKTEKAKYLIIVCSASKFGDYFCGGEGSVMCVDDFELVYE